MCVPLKQPVNTTLSSINDGALLGLTMSRHVMDPDTVDGPPQSGQGPLSIWRKEEAAVHGSI